MFGVQDGVAVIREQVGRWYLPTRKGALFRQTKHEATGELHTRATHKVVVNVAVELYVLRKLAVCVGEDLAAVLWIAERGTLRAVGRNRRFFLRNS